MKIIQVTPAPEKMVLLYEDDGSVDGFYTEPPACLALCSEGPTTAVSPMEINEDGVDLAERNPNFRGVFWAGSQQLDEEVQLLRDKFSKRKV